MKRMQSSNVQHCKEEVDISCHHEDNYYSSQPLQINVIKSPIEFRSRINWAKLSSKAIALETSEMNTVSLNHKLSENTARSRETAKKRLQPFDSNDLPIKSNTLLATSSKPSSLMWQQAVRQVAKSQGMETIEISAGADTIRNFNRQILKNTTPQFNTTSWRIARPDSAKVGTVSPVSSSKSVGHNDTCLNNSQFMDEDILPKRFNKQYSLGYYINSIILPTFRNSFNGLLEDLYNRYIFMERRWSLLALLILLVLHNMVYLVFYAATISINNLAATAATTTSLSIIVILTFRCEDPCMKRTSEKLRLYGFGTWLVITAFSLVALLNTTWEQRADLSYLSDGMPLLLCFVFITYTMLPLPLTSSACLAVTQCFIEICGRTVCFLLATTRSDTNGNSYSTIQPTYTSVVYYEQNVTGNYENRKERATSQIESAESMVFARLISALVVVTLGVHMAGIWTGFLMDRAQRQTYIEVRQCIKSRIKIERENYNQERLILSVIPRFIALQMFNDISRPPSSPKRSTKRMQNDQINKLYIRKYENVSILYADVKGFTHMSTVLPPQELVSTLNDTFARFDRLAEKHHCLRIKILGDCYYCICGVPDPRTDHACCCVEMGLDMIEELRRLQYRKGELQMRIGIHTGTVLCGVLGLRKWQFDVWSNDVLIANAMESAGVAGRVHITESVYKCISNEYEVEDGYGEDRNTFLKEQGIKTYLVVDRQPLVTVSKKEPFVEECRTAETNKASRMRKAQSPKETLLHVPEIPRPRVPSIIADQPSTTDRIKLDPVKSEEQSTIEVNAASNDISSDKKTLIRRRWRMPVVVFKVFGMSPNLNTNLENGAESRSPRDHDSRAEGIETSKGEANLSKRIKQRLESRSSLSPPSLPKFPRLSRRNRLTSVQDKDWKAELPFENLLNDYASRKALRKGLSRSMDPSNSILPPSMATAMPEKSDYEEINDRLLKSIASGNYREIGKKQIRDLTVTFANADLESEFSHLRDELFKSNLLLSCLVVAFIIAIQFCITPAEMYFNYVNLGLFITVYGLLIFLTVAEDHPSLPRRMRFLSSYVQESIHARYLVIYIALILNLAVAITGMLSCLPVEKQKTERFIPCRTQNLSIYYYSTEPQSLCSNPNFFFYIGVLVLITSSVFLRVHNFIKLLNLGVVIVVFGVISLLILPDTFTSFEVKRQMKMGPCSGIANAVWDAVLQWLTLLLFGILVYYQNRRIEYTTRLDFIRKLEGIIEVEGMKTLQRHNQELLRNILPDHVATHFLERSKDDEGLYSCSHDCVGVIFASIPNFTTKGGLKKDDSDSLKLLNEIIFDVDQLIGQERFRCLEKIKTIGSTYMAASGLTPHNIEHAVPGTEDFDSRCEGDHNQTAKQAQTEDVEKQVVIKSADISHISMLAHFSLLLQRVIADINLHSYNDFSMRIGIAFGPVVAGVIGAKKPQYDIWGKTVNLASRMETTGVCGMIQVPEEMYQALSPRGFQFSQRGEVIVKGIGTVQTYFLTGCTAEAARQAGVDRALSDLGTGFGADGNFHLGDASANGGRHSLAQVVYSLVQARQRHKRYGAASGRVTAANTTTTTTPTTATTAAATTTTAIAAAAATTTTSTATSPIDATTTFTATSPTATATTTTTTTTTATTTTDIVGRHSLNNSP